MIIPNCSMENRPNELFRIEQQNWPMYMATI